MAGNHASSTAPQPRAIYRFSALAIGLLAIAVAWSISGAPSALAVTIELKDAAPERIENQRRYAKEQAPLPGTPDLTGLSHRLEQEGLKAGSAVLLRIFKAEAEVELWMRKGDTYTLFATYPVCNWSGTLGPKLAEGDKQTPEGFYTIGRRQLHRIGRWPRSLNLGFPNVYDRSLARTGSYILLHGGCSSVGCFAMTNPVISEIYTLVEKAIFAGQDNVPVHVFPFRMTDENMQRHGEGEWKVFWQNLREGYDAFEQARTPPRVSVCNGRYQFTSFAPGEGGEASPLDACGDTLAAVQALEEFVSVARHHPLLSRTSWRTQPAQWALAANEVPHHLQGAFVLYRQAMDAVARLVAENARLPPARRRNPKALIATIARSSPHSCNPSRASCRRFIALKEERSRHRAIKTEHAAPRRSRSASRSR